MTNVGIASAPAGAVIVRPATAADDAARCALFARVAMETELVLSVRRDPEFDALYRLQSSQWESLVVELDGEVEGTATMLLRDGYLNGEVRRVGYLGDLRLSPRLEGRMLLDRFYAPLLERARDEFGCELFLTAVIASNERALRALARETPRSRRARRPRYTPIGEFDIRSLHLLLPKRPGRSSFRVRRASEADAAAIERFLDGDARSRPFGLVFRQGELARRLTSWPGLCIGDFHLAVDGTGALVGCLALWDAAPVKRLVVSEYRGSMRSVRRWYDLAARIVGAPTLPRPGEPLRYLYVTHQAVPTNDPVILHALLTAAYREARRRQGGHHLLSVCAPVGSPLAPAFRGFLATDLRARLFAVTLPGVELPLGLIGGAWPGFEMALV